MANDNNEKIELAVFREFAKVCPLPLLADTAENRNPPEPDILCKLESGVKLAFELTSVEDEISKGVSVKRVVNDYRKLTSDLEAEFRRGMVDGRITNSKQFDFHSIQIEFQEDVSLPRRQKAIPDVVKMLNEFGPGKCPVNDKVIRLIRCEPFSVRRSYAGPIFNAGSTSCTVGNSTVKNVNKKLSKLRKGKYETGHLIHLLAWSERASAEELNLLEADKELATLLTSGGVQFARVWVYGRGKKAIVFDSGSVLTADK